MAKIKNKKTIKASQGKINMTMFDKLNAFKEQMKDIAYDEAESKRLIKQARDSGKKEDISKAAWYNGHRLIKYMENNAELYCEFGCEFEDMFLVGFEALYAVVESDTVAIQKINQLSNKHRFTSTAVVYETIYNAEIGFGDLLELTYQTDIKQRRECLSAPKVMQEKKLSKWEKLMAPEKLKHYLIKD